MQVRKYVAIKLRFLGSQVSLDGFLHEVFFSGIGCLFEKKDIIAIYSSWGKAVKLPFGNILCACICYIYIYICVCIYVTS